jgi:hypothetical protein
MKLSGGRLRAVAGVFALCGLQAALAVAAPTPGPFQIDIDQAWLE